MTMFFNAGDTVVEQIANHAEGALGFWFQPNTSCSGQNLLGIGNSTNGKLTVVCTGGNISVCMYDPSIPADVCTTSVTISVLAQPYFVMARWDDAANTLNINIWDGSTTTTLSSATAWTSPGTWELNFLEFGFSGNCPTCDAYFDNLMISNDSSRNFITDLGPNGTTLLMNYTQSPR